MTYVYLLTELQKNDLVGKLYAPDSFFNPIQDNDLNWVISQEEVNQCSNPEFTWVKDLPMIEYKPKEVILE